MEREGVKYLKSVRMLGRIERWSWRCHNALLEQAFRDIAVAVGEKARWSMVWNMDASMKLINRVADMRRGEIVRRYSARQKCRVLLRA